MAQRGPKPLGAAGKSEMVFARVTMEQKALWDSLGGARWLRERLAEAKVAQDAAGPAKPLLEGWKCPG